MNRNHIKFETIIGLVGGAASGKDTVAEIFRTNGYGHISSSNLVRDEIMRRGLRPSRELQTEVANEIRSNRGVGYWIDLSLQSIPRTFTKVVISGIYSPGEGKYLQNMHSGLLVGVTIGEVDDPYARFERLKSRESGSRDELSYEEFLAAHNRENSGTSEYETNLNKLFQMARFMIYNSADLLNLERQTISVINALGGK